MTMRDVSRAVRDRLERGIDERVFPGCAFGYVLATGERGFVTAGRLTYDSNAPAVTENTVYDVASVTKAIPTSCLALTEVERGRLSTGDLLIKFVPEYRGSFRDQVTIAHLLTHGLAFDFQLSSCRDLGPDGILDRILSASLRCAPGTSFAYANATSILLGLVIERAMGTPLDRCAHDVFFGPLGMEKTTFVPDDGVWKSIAPTEFDRWRGRLIQGEVHDESAWALRPGLIAGSAGLFSTAPDLLNFLEMLVRGGVWGGSRYFEESTVVQMYTNQRPSVTGEWTGLGWELNQPRFMGKNCRESTFGKTGFTGCSAILDNTAGGACVLLANSIYPQRKKDRSEINVVRADVAELFFGSIAG